LRRPVDGFNRGLAEANTGTVGGVRYDRPRKCAHCTRAVRHDPRVAPGAKQPSPFVGPH